MSHQSLDEIIGQYVVALESGDSPDRQRLLEDYREHAEALEAFFQDFDRMRDGLSPLGKEALEETRDEQAQSEGQAEFSVPLSEQTKKRVESRLKELGNPSGNDSLGSTTGPDDESIEIQVVDEKYKLLQPIGAGGMGRVYMSEQFAPVKRRVALKVIKTDTPTKEILARFEAERQALAMMDHVNIAKVLDAGVTKEGRPYFAMELVSKNLTAG